MVYVAITPIGLFGSDKEKVEKFSDINYRKLFKEDEIVDKLYLMRTNPRKLLDEIKDWGEVKFEFFSGPNSVGNYLREHLFEIGKELKYFTDYEDFKRKMNYWNLELTKRLIKSYAQQKDKIIIQVAEAISDLDKVLNLLSERLREWYSLYFPELNSIQKHETYVKLITTLKKRENFTKSQLKKYFSSKVAEKIAENAKSSMGGEFEDYDLEAVVKFAEEISHLYEKRKDLYEYLEKLMKEEAPNLTKLAGVSLGAKLICLAGGLEKLAKLPASTIQVLGAEKALFAHLRLKVDPPKHGVIYNHPLIKNAPKWQRGKIARALACKLAIAARADYLGDDIADELYEKLMKRVEEIRKKYPKPPKKKKVKKKFKKKKEKRFKKKREKK
ncbi:hypothetical protein [Methanocaldococcus villosus]|nr:hypothetical protein [Methanocaldococcus villosus]